MSKWISVKTEMPRDKSGHALIYRPDAIETQGSKVQIVPSYMVRIMTDATHWMPLPAPPQEGE